MHFQCSFLQLEANCNANALFFIRKFGIALNTHSNKHLMEATQRFVAAKLTRLTQKAAILQHVVAESCTVCHSWS
jgi:hypothetical protein